MQKRCEGWEKSGAGRVGDSLMKDLKLENFGG